LSIKDIYSDPKRIVITAHRGFSGRYPENTIVAFEKAYEAGADLIEFDVRLTRDERIVVSHDGNLKRVCAENISIDSLTLKEIREMCSAGKRPIHTFDEVLDFFESARRKKQEIGMNIQIKESHEVLIRQACRIFRQRDLYKSAYFTVSTFREAEMVRSFDSDIELCVLERKKVYDKSLLREMKDFGCNFLQPHRRDVTPGLVRIIRELGFLENVYYSNTDGDNRRFISYGIRGILTDYPDVLVKTVTSLGL